MKTISIRQPWAWLIIRPDLTGEARRNAIASGIIKDIENRTWQTNVRGTVLIHAAQTYPKREYDEDRHYFELAGIILPKYEDLPRGGIVGHVDIVDCVRESNSRWFNPGGFGFALANAKPCEFYPCKGMLGFFRLRDARFPQVGAA